MTTSFCVLPEGIIETLRAQLSEEAQTNPLAFLRLPHPRTGLPSLFLPTYGPGSHSSIIEIQEVSPSASRSWFNGGEVISDGSLKLMTPIDPAFLLLPLLRAAYPNGIAGNFRTADDIFEDASSKLAGETCQGDAASAHIPATDVLAFSEHPRVQEAMLRICEVKDITADLVVYRYSEAKFLDYLRRKVERLSRTGVIDGSKTLERELLKDGLFDDGKDSLLQSGRLKLACDTVSQYIPPDIHQALLSNFDFAALSAHVESLQAASLVAIESQNSNGRSQANGDSQKGQDGKKRKAAGQGSRGVEKLKKVNAKGMAKLSSFFQKAKA